MITWYHIQFYNVPSLENSDLNFIKEIIFFIHSNSYPADLVLFDPKYPIEGIFTYYLSVPDRYHQDIKNILSRYPFNICTPPAKSLLKPVAGKGAFFDGDE